MSNLKQSENSHGASISKKFSIIKRAESFTHAGRGLYIFLKSTHNAWLDIVAFVLVFLMGLFFQITKIEWIMIFIVSGIVFISEAFNTAIEIDMNLTSPTFHPFAKDTKDVAAGAVLISAILAVIVGIMIFSPYIKTLY
jgi:diacylglycerol kinase (ATP)